MSAVTVVLSVKRKVLYKFSKWYPTLYTFSPDIIPFSGTEHGMLYNPEVV